MAWKDVDQFDCIAVDQLVAGAHGWTLESLSYREFSYDTFSDVSTTEKTSVLVSCCIERLHNAVDCCCLRTVQHCCHTNDAPAQGALFLNSSTHVSEQKSLLKHSSTTGNHNAMFDHLQRQRTGAYGADCVQLLRVWGESDNQDFQGSYALLDLHRALQCIDHFLLKIDDLLKCGSLSKVSIERPRCFWTKHIRQCCDGRVLCMHVATPHES
jgi:hypothetical protein